MKVTSEELIMLQSLPLDIKIAKTKLRIREWVKHWGLENVAVSFSGGKDSTVLLDIARQEFPDMKATFVDTGLEYPELKEHVRSYDNVDIIKPKMSFKQVIEKYGYPVVSKEQSRYIYDCRHSTPKMRKLRINGSTKQGAFKLSKKWYYLLDAPFEISDKCCAVMKKGPVKQYYADRGIKEFVGIMADESNMRKVLYQRFGCNAFEAAHQRSTPIAFWTEQDILEYIYTFKLKIPSVYGEVIKKDGKFITTGLHRTGCMFCLYGIQFEKGYNRIQRLQVTHPSIHKYILDVLKYREVMEYLGYPHSIPEEEFENAKKLIESGEDKFTELPTYKTGQCKYRPTQRRLWLPGDTNKSGN